jgi:hypothetical protein
MQRPELIGREYATKTKNKNYLSVERDPTIIKETTVRNLKNVYGNLKNEWNKNVQI